MENQTKEITIEKELNDRMFAEINKSSDKLINGFMICYFLFGLFLSLWYDTWIIAFGVGGICTGLYFLTQKMFPNKTIHHFVASASSGFFVAQYIYQMHGMFEMHFFAFIAAPLMITYQNWKTLIPAGLVIAVHHGLFAYLEYTGNDKIFFTTEAYDMDLTAFLFHVSLAVLVLAICGFWSYNLEQRTRNNTKNMVIIERNNDNMIQNIEYLSMLANGKTDFKVEGDKNDLMAELITKVQQRVK